MRLGRKNQNRNKRKALVEAGTVGANKVLDSFTFGIPAALFNGCAVYSDSMFKAKVAEFIKNLYKYEKNIGEEYINQFRGQDERFQKEFFYKLNAINEEKRIDYFTKVFTKVRAKKISIKDWDRLSFIITDVSYLDIEDFKEIGKLEKINLTTDGVKISDEKIAIINKMVWYGLLIEARSGEEVLISDFSGNKTFKLTEIGELFIKYI